MIKGRVSVVIPACNEVFLQHTIDSLLDGAAGDVEIIAVIDGGPWPAPPHDRFLHHPRVTVVRNNEQQGMRQSFNAAAEIATGEFLMKCDGHCIFAPGWDQALKADCDDDWLVVPTRHSIDGEAWKANPKDGAKAIKKRNYNYHSITFPFLSSMYGSGFHAISLPWDLNKAVNDQRAHLPVDDILSAQGSCWFTPAANFRRLGPLDHERLYFYQEAQCVMFRQLAAGGRCVINKNLFYGHLHKGNNNLHTIDGRVGRGFFLNVKRKRSSEATIVDWCLNGWPWPYAKRTFESMIEQHWWLISQVTDPRYVWPSDWREWDKHREAFDNRPPDAIPAHT